ncbi:hypothetical protein Avbf_16639, partial [Armadillidium vulgare]
CLYNEEGVPFSFDVSPPQIDFYIPHNWANNEDNLNHLKIRLFNTNLVLRHPLSTKKDSNDVNLPLNEMKIGWNRIYLNANGRTVQVEIVKRNSQNFIQNITLLERNSLFLYQPHIFKDSFHVSGLYSLVNCFKGNPSSYFKIRAKSNFTVPFTLTQGHNRFKVFSESNPFTFELFSSGHKRKDILEYNNSIFTTIVLHNTGDTDFYIQIEDNWPPTNAPISLLKGKFSFCGYNGKRFRSSFCTPYCRICAFVSKILYSSVHSKYAAREDIDFFLLCDKSYLARGSSYFDFDKPVRSNAESPDQIGIPPHVSKSPGRLNKEEATE